VAANDADCEACVRLSITAVFVLHRLSFGVEIIASMTTQRFSFVADHADAVSH
jgi:hypothetical protein